jgi:2-octaprenyl-6-methoxyphenol hydroxylase
MDVIKSEVAIVGGGLVGAVLAIGLTQKKVSVTVIDREALDQQIKPENDGRTTAVSYGSQQIFNELGVWENMEPYAQPIWEIRVFEDGSPWTVDYDYKDIGPNPMGYIIENKVIREAIQSHLDSPYLNWVAPANIESTKRLKEKVVVTLQDQRIIEAKLLVGAEGRFSPTRNQSSISTKTWEYSQIALVAHIQHEKPHNGTAWEIFFPEGPLAVLPMFDCPETGRPRSGLVWVKSKKHDWKKETDEQLASKLLDHFPFYGKMQFCSRRWTYPLSALTVDSMIDDRLVLIGDAAHVVHPIAGQGVNLGWRDAIALAECIKEAASLGLDIGSYTTLSHYQKKRKPDHRSVLLMMDGINRLFSNSSTTLHILRNAGFSVVNNVKPLKRFFMKKAMGI